MNRFTAIEKQPVGLPLPSWGDKKLYRDLGRIGINFTTRIFGNVAGKFLGFLTIPVIARALGPEIYGQFNLIMVILGYTAFFVDFGFGAYGVRETAKQEDSHAMISQILSARLTLALVSILSCMAVIFILFSANLHLIMIISIGYIWVIAQGVNIDYFYFGKKNMLVPTAGQISGQLIYVLLVLLFIKKPDHLALLIFFYSSYCLLTSVIGLAYYIRKHPRIPVFISLKKAWAVLKKTFRLGISTRIESFQSSFPVIIISVMLGNYALGIFSAAFKFFTIILMIFQAVMLALAPYLVKLKQLSPGIQQKYILLLSAGMLLTGILAAIFFYGFGEMMVALLFGESFGPAAPIFGLICFILIPFTPITMVFSSLLIYFDFDKKYLTSITAAGIVILVFTPLLVYFMSIKGAILAMALSNFTNIGVSVYYINKIIPHAFGGAFKKKDISIQWEQV
ncbi:MAG: oligosaccharide flippase family protein [Acidobacteria bacterium]|jgi:O-antigen/teichoic acid export membrane protein|nr:oligosaccharide flippase family protein [Acidobacteriota bacterium]